MKLQSTAMMKEDKHYILQVGSAGSSRLDLLQELHAKYSFDLWCNIKLKPGAVILDLGCGTGTMTQWLAEKYPQCKILALDNSAEQIQMAQRRIHKKKINNVEFIKININHIHQIHKTFKRIDIIYARYFLIHIQNPELILKELVQLLKIKGRIILEEPTMSTAFCYPYRPHYEKSRNLLAQLAKVRGLDFEIGVKVQAMLQQLGLSIERSNLIQPLLRSQSEKKLLYMLMEESADAYRAEKLITSDDLKEMIAGLKHLLAEDIVLIGFPRTTQICARKIKEII